jgi:hypothetical protein
MALGWKLVEWNWQRWHNACVKPVSVVDVVWRVAVTRDVVPDGVMM